MAQQEKLSSEISEMWEIYEKCMPDVARAYDELPMEVYKDGVLSGKIKRLMALTGALVHGCRACILYQTEESVGLGSHGGRDSGSLRRSDLFGRYNGSWRDRPCRSVFRGERTFGGVKEGQLMKAQPFSD